MFDIGWTEMVLIIVVLIIVIGPKELPRALHTLGQWIGKVRAMSRQFQDSIEQMAHQSGLDDVRKEVEQMSDFSIEDQVNKAVDPSGELTESFNIESGALDAPKEDTPKKKKKPAIKNGAKNKSKNGEGAS
jgi:sec-independent protein translocase protein TatB